MKDEAETCTILKNSFIAQGHYFYKVPDPTDSYGATIQRIFDMFGRFNDKPVYAEVKYMNGMKSFNLQEIKEHQINGLLEYDKIKDSLCYIFLGVHAGHGDSRIYKWPVKEIYPRWLEKRNFFKKELETLPFYTIKKKLIVDTIEL